MRICWTRVQQCIWTSEELQPLHGRHHRAMSHCIWCHMNYSCQPALEYHGIYDGKGHKGQWRHGSCRPTPTWKGRGEWWVLAGELWCCTEELSEGRESWCPGECAKVPEDSLEELGNVRTETYREQGHFQLGQSYTAKTFGGASN